MQLVFEVCGASSGEPHARKVFDGAGGVVGRGAGCDWVIPDTRRLLSSHHGLVSYWGGQYFLTDISSNGIGVAGSTEHLCKGQARLISDGDVYRLGAVDIRAKLMAQSITKDQQAYVCIDTIPDGVFLDGDPLRTLESTQWCDESFEELEALTLLAEAPTSRLSRAAVDRDCLTMPGWAERGGQVAATQPTVAAAPVAEAFWSQFGDALGVAVDVLDPPAREALAIKVAGLFRQTLEGLQQSLRTRDELNSELGLGWSTPPLNSRNPLHDCADTHSAMTSLLGLGELGPWSAQVAVAQACWDMQVHQLALVVACRAAMRGAVAAFAPDHLLLCFEGQGRLSRFGTDGSHWRAYQRHYQRLVDEPLLGERLLRNDFSKAYEEQLRLVSTLHATNPR